MTNKHDTCIFCHMTFILYLVFLGLMSYYVTSYALLLLLFGFSCKRECKTCKHEYDEEDEEDEEKPKEKINLNKVVE
jgi:hypothetical protein